MPLELLQQAAKIAVAASVRKRIEESIEIVKRNIEYATCWFCEARPAEDGAALEVKMYGNVTHSGNRVWWQQGAIPVPRCATCKSAHRRQNTFKTLGGVASALLVVAGIGGCTEIDEAGWAFLTFGICVALAFGVYYALKAIGRPPEGIKREEIKDKFPEVMKRVSEGWGIGEKPPDVQ